MAETDSNFLEEQRRAVERMNEMYRRQQINADAHPMPPTPDFVKVNGTNTEKYASRNEDSKKSNNGNSSSHKVSNRSTDNNGISGGFFGNINMPFMNGIKLDRDITLIIGLLLILASENADKRLMLALLYILI